MTSSGNNRQSYLERWGLLRFLYSAMMRRASRYLGLVHCIVVMRPLQEDAPPPDDGREYRLLTRQELLRFCEDPELDLDREQVAASLDRGDTCAGCLEEGQLLGYMWRAYEPNPHSGNLYVEFADHCRYGYKSLTRPEHRGKRIQTNLVRSTEHQAETGRTHSIGFIRSDNYPSLRSARFSGNQVVGFAGYWKPGRRAYCYRSPGARKAGFRFVQRS